MSKVSEDKMQFRIQRWKELLKNCKESGLACIIFKIHQEFKSACNVCRRIHRDNDIRKRRYYFYALGYAIERVFKRIYSGIKFFFPKKRELQ